MHKQTKEIIYRGAVFLKLLFLKSVFVSLPLLMINGLHCYSHILRIIKAETETQTSSSVELFILMLDYKVIWGNLSPWDNKNNNIHQATPCQVSRWCWEAGRAIIAAVSCVYLLSQPPLPPFILRVSVLWPEDGSGQQYCQLRPQAVSKSHSFKRSFCSA